jgi:DNA-binding response OmpR family regulator
VKAADDAAAARPPVVLVVEDEPQVMRFLRATLPAHGYRVIEATSGAQALVECQTRQPDLVLLDLGLPDLDGLEVTRRLRAWSAVPIVVVSARGQERDKVAALAKHAGKVLTHRQLLVEVWGPASASESHYLRVYMAQLRHKLEDDPARPRHLLTETGVGYRLRAE